MHKAQMGFRKSQAVLRGYCGGRGAGKTFVGAYDSMRRFKPGRFYAVYAPTYKTLKDSTLREFFRIGRQLSFVRDYNKTDGLITLGNGAQVIARSLEDPDSARGPNLSGAYVDEGSLVKSEAIDIILGCLRECGEQGWFSTTFTPKGKQHWTYEFFGPDGDPQAEMFHSATRDNPFLPPNFEDLLRRRYTSAFASQEVEGLFVDLSGNLLSRSWFQIVDASPKHSARCRFWDMAATEPKKGKDPDWTAGALVALNDGVWYIEDMRRVQLSPRRTEELVKHQAKMDGNIKTRMEEEGGSSGKTAIDGYARKVLVGLDFLGRRSTGSKVLRANPFAAAAEAGNVCLVKSDWNKAFLDEVELFPNGKHDDQVDAVSGAFNELSRPEPVMVIV